MNNFVDFSKFLCLFDNLEVLEMSSKLVAWNYQYFFALFNSNFACKIFGLNVFAEFAEECNPRKRHVHIFPTAAAATTKCLRTIVKTDSFVLSKTLCIYNITKHSQFRTKTGGNILFKVIVLLAWFICNTDICKWS